MSLVPEIIYYLCLCLSILHQPLNAVLSGISLHGVYGVLVQVSAAVSMLTSWTVLWFELARPIIHALLMIGVMYRWFSIALESLKINLRILDVETASHVLSKPV